MQKHNEEDELSLTALLKIRGDTPTLKEMGFVPVSWDGHSKGQENDVAILRLLQEHAAQKQEQHMRRVA